MTRPTGNRQGRRRTTRLHQRALCCECGALWESTTHRDLRREPTWRAEPSKLLGDADDAPRCVVILACEVCGDKRLHAALRNDEYRDHFEVALGWRTDPEG